MTVGIAQEYFDNNLAGTTGFALDEENGIYTKTIEETDLNFEFSADTDGKCERDFDFILSYFLEIILSHSVATTSTGFSISETSAVR